jgi:hypothetical protein
MRPVSTVEVVLVIHSICVYLLSDGHAAAHVGHTHVLISGGIGGASSANQKGYFRRLRLGLRGK